MNLTQIGKKTEKFVIDTSPAILTGIGCVGLVSTAVLTGSATVKAVRLVDHDARVGGVDYPDRREFVKKTWKLYIPAVGTGVLSCVAIVGANRIGNRRAAAIAAAYSLSEKAFSEYKDKVVNHLGANKEQALRDEMAQDRINNNPPTREAILVDGNEVLCYDQYSGRYFKNTMEGIKKAQNDLNYRIIHDNYASLSDFYDLLGLRKTSSSDEVGWNVDEQLELTYSAVLTEDQKPVIAVDFVVYPVRDYYKLH